MQHPTGSCPSSSRWLALLALAAALVASPPANALTIVPTFGAGVDSTAQQTINNVIAGYSALFNDPVTVYIKFDSMSGGLGQSSTYAYDISYAAYIADLRSDASSAADTTAMASVPSGPNPVLSSTDPTHITVTRAQARAVG